MPRDRSAPYLTAYGLDHLRSTFPELEEVFAHAAGRGLYAPDIVEKAVYLGILNRVAPILDELFCRGRDIPKWLNA